MRNRFSPTPVAANAPQHMALETADLPGVEEVAAERGVNNNADSHTYVGKSANPFGLNPVYTRRLKRKMVEVVGCGVASGIMLTLTAALTTTSAHWSVFALFGVGTGYLLSKSVIAACQALAFQSLDRVNAQTWRLSCERAQLENFGLTCELSAARQETNTVYTAYLFAAAASAGAAPAEEDQGAFSSSSADVLFMKPNKTKAVH